MFCKLSNKKSKQKNPVFTYLKNIIKKLRRINNCKKQYILEKYWILLKENFYSIKLYPQSKTCNFF